VCRSGERGRWSAYVVALLTEPNVRAAAARAGVPERTARRLLTNPKFLDMLRQARRAVLEAATARLQQLTAEAVETLHRNMSSGAPGAEVRAAGLVLERATAAAELSDVVASMDELRRKLEELQARESNRAKS
jgi:hypothetical protein